MRKLRIFGKEGKQMPETKPRVNLSAVPAAAQVDLCVIAIIQTAAAMDSQEGREAVEKGKEKYLRHLAERERSQT